MRETEIHENPQDATDLILGLKEKYEKERSKLLENHALLRLTVLPEEANLEREEAFDEQLAMLAQIQEYDTDRSIMRNALLFDRESKLSHMSRAKFSDIKYSNAMSDYATRERRIAHVLLTEQKKKLATYRKLIEQALEKITFTMAKPTMFPQNATHDSNVGPALIFSRFDDLLNYITENQIEPLTEESAVRLRDLLKDTKSMPVMGKVEVGDYIVISHASGTLVLYVFSILSDTRAVFVPFVRNQKMRDHGFIWNYASTQ